MMKYLVTHDSHELKKGDTYEGDRLPLWLVGKATLIKEKEFVVATPAGKKTTKKADK